MYSPMRPITPNTAFTARQAAPVGGAAAVAPQQAAPAQFATAPSIPQAAPTTIQPASTGGFGHFIDSIFGFIGRLFSRIFGQPATSTGPAALSAAALPPTAATVPVAPVTPSTTVPTPVAAPAPVAAPTPLTVASTPVTQPAPVATAPTPVAAPAPVATSQAPVAAPAATPVATTPAPVTSPAPVATAPSPVVAPAPVATVPVAVSAPVATAPAPVTVPTVLAPVVAPTPVMNPQVSGLTSDQITLCRQQGIQATLANYQAFMAEAQAIQNQNDIGPGSTDVPSITELQQVLSTWGYPCTQNGQFDQTTLNAVLKFKQDNNLYASYKMADGSQGLNPFIDAATKALMITKIQAQPVVTTPVAPPVAAPVSAPPAPAAPAPVTATASAPLSADQAAIAGQFHLQADAANITAYQAASAKLVAAGAIGPSSSPASAPTDAVTQLQQVLSGWGYTCAVSGQFDQATIDAILQFKFDNKLTDGTFKMSDGSSGITPFFDDATKALMRQKLGG